MLHCPGRYGASSIPPHWVDDIQQWDNHGEIALRGVLLAAAAPRRKGEGNGEGGTLSAGSADTAAAAASH